MNIRDRKLLTAALRHARMGSATPRSGKNDLWSFLNSAFGIWALSSIVIGIITWTFTQYEDCTSKFVFYEDRFAKLLTEYQFREGRYKAAMANANFDYKKAETFRGPDTEYIFSEFKGKTLADISSDLIRSFGNLSIYSDIESFDADSKYLQIDYGSNGSKRTFIAGEPPSTILAELAGSLSNFKMAPSDPAANANSKNISMTKEQEERIAQLKNELELGPTTLAARVAVMVAPQRRCGMLSIVGRLFEDTNEMYKTAISKYYKKVYEDLSDNEIRSDVAGALVNDLKGNGVQGGNGIDVSGRSRALDVPEGGKD